MADLKVKLYADGADKAGILEMAKDPMIAGFTTNPSLMKKAGISDYEGFAREILAEVTDKPISFEVFSDEFADIERQAAKIKSWGENVYVKIPVMNSEGEVTYSLIEKLSHSGVKLNVTALFTEEQITKVGEALTGGAPSVVSVFAGRVADTGVDPLPMMEWARDFLAAKDKNMELLWASTREVFNIIQADRMGCHIITVPHDILAKYKKMQGKDLLEMSLDTVKTFKKDSDAAGFSL